MTLSPKIEILVEIILKNRFVQKFLRKKISGTKILVWKRKLFVSRMNNNFKKQFFCNKYLTTTTRVTSETEDYLPEPGRH
jgi:hypothetical protein